MQQFLLFFIAAAFVACESTTPTTSDNTAADSIPTPKETPVPEPGKPADEEPFPPISIYANRKYSPRLQRELDARNDKRPRKTEIMTLVDAQRGEDGGMITFKDDQGKTREFYDWEDPLDWNYTEVEWGETVNDEEKGVHYRITYQQEAYWSDPAGTVVENWTISKMVAVD